MKKTLITLLLAAGILASLFSQNEYYKNQQFTKADTLRGMLSPARSAYDVSHYSLDIEVIPGQRFLKGSVDMSFEVTDNTDEIQVDLFENMKLEKVIFQESELKFKRLHNAVFIKFPYTLEKGTSTKIHMHYSGKPIVAKRAPWDGGFVWSSSESKPWIGVACEGDGASLWWPNKDHLSDEPDSMEISITVPADLTAIANGDLRSMKNLNGDRRKYNWAVTYPINNYNVTLNIGDYVHFEDTYTAIDGSTMPLDYYVLRENEQRARKHFQQVPKVLSCFEQYFGKYPFWEDGYALVETPYLGMEHQGAIAYGNKYMRGYLGGMIPRDMDWDYIIVHETGHEWWGNSISCSDLSEMWIHESFTTYMEALYVECAYDYDRSVEYMASQRPYIANKQPILGPKDVNWHHWSASDHYYKGSWMLHTLRHAIANDSLWFDILRSFYDKHAISHIHTEDFVNYVNDKTRRDWSPFFDQYLRHPKVPTLLYRINETKEGLMLRARFDTDVPNFSMPVQIGSKDNAQLIEINSERTEHLFKGWKKSDFYLNPNLYLINLKEI